jgi:hypothetical protein
MLGDPPFDYEVCAPQNVFRPFPSPGVLSCLALRAEVSVAIAGDWPDDVPPLSLLLSHDSHHASKPYSESSESTNHSVMKSADLTICLS